MQVLATIFVRRGLDFFFSEHELRWLDGSGNARKHKKTSEEKPEVVKEEEEDLPVPKVYKYMSANHTTCILVTPNVLKVPIILS